MFYFYQYQILLADCLHSLFLPEETPTNQNLGETDL